jgi:hypothetical protein
MTNKLTRKANVWIVVATITLLFMLKLFVAETPKAYGQSCETTVSFDEWISGSTTRRLRVRQYTFYGTAGYRASIQMQKGDYSNIDPYLELQDPYGYIVAADDDGAGNSNSWIQGYYLQSSGCYTIIARSYQNTTYGQFWLYTSLY